MLHPEHLSRLIGQIYDCALDPALWPQTLAVIGEATHCCAGMISVVDLETAAPRIAQTWNFDNSWTEEHPEYAEEVAQLWLDFLHSQPPLDEPHSSIKAVPHAAETRYYREWLRPRGIIDSINLVVLRQPGRVGDFGLSRHESQGLVGERDLATLRLLAPHIRRAITVSDLLDAQRLEREALAATLDGLTAGVFIVTEDADIVHTNAAALHMLEAGSPVLSADGRLAAASEPLTHELRQAIAQAGVDEARLGTAGIGVPLLQAGRSVAAAHVLPLARGELRTRLAPTGAAAAVFVMPGGASSPCDGSTLARIFGLTPAEARHLGQLLAGATLAEAAKALGVSPATARTHRERIFAKMGVSRRSELVALASDLRPPVWRPPKR